MLETIIAGCSVSLVMIPFRKSIIALIIVSFSVWIATMIVAMPKVAADGYSYVSTRLETEGNISISVSTINYGIGESVQADYLTEFVMSSDSPSIQITMNWYGNNSEAITSKATLTVFSSLFTWPNGSAERLFFWDDPYYSNFFPDSVKNDSGIFSCSYVLNLSSQVNEAEAKFANRMNETNAIQSYLGARISFSVILDTVRMQGQERHLEFLFSKDNVNPFSDMSFLLQTSVSIPSDAEFTNPATLDGVEMNKVLKTVGGFIEIPYSDLNSHRTVVEWNVPSYPPWWENAPQSWVLSSLLGVVVISVPFSYAWHEYQKPRLKLDPVDKGPKEPAIHPINHIAFYHLNAINNGRTTAFDSEILLTFKDAVGKELFSLKGKWDRGPALLGPLQQNLPPQVWPALIPFGEQTNVRPNVPESFCIVVKDNEDCCYAFNGESYLFGYKRPEWRLPLGDFILDVEIRSGNTRVLSRFMLKNKGNTTQGVEVTKMVRKLSERVCRR